MELFSITTYLPFTDLRVKFITSINVICEYFFMPFSIKCLDKYSLHSQQQNRLKNLKHSIQIYLTH